MSERLPPRPARPDFVRPFVITGGRTRAADTSLRMETMVQSTGVRDARLSLEHAQIVDVCASACSIAEVAAEIGLPLGVAMVLVDDLVQGGYVEPSHSDPVEIELSTLTRMIERVRAL